MIGKVLTAASIVLAVTVAACRPARSPGTVRCTLVGRDTTDEAVKKLYANHRASLVVTETAVYVCGCGGRRIDGAVEQSKFGGGTEVDRLAGKVENAKVAGAIEADKMGGATEHGQTGGATEQGRTGGAAEQGKLAGDTESGKLAGDVQPLTCHESASCLGFEVSGAGAIRVYASTGWNQPTKRCVLE